MKLKRSQLKALIKECLYDILEEDGDIMTDIVKDVIMEMKEQRRRNVKRGERSASRTQVEQHQKHTSGTTTSEIVAASGTSDDRSNLWEALAADTLQNTLVKQGVAERKVKPGPASWEALISSDTIEEGPMTHLAAAQGVHSTVNNNSSTPLQGTQIVSEAAPTSMPAASPPARRVSHVPTQSELTKQFSHMLQNENVRDKTNDVVVPDDLAALGIGDMSAFID